MSWLAIDYIKHSLLVDARWQEGVKWAGTALIAASAVLVSFFPALSHHASPFIGFFFGHILWTSMGIVLRDKPLVAVNGFFIPIDIYAMYIRL